MDIVGTRGFKGKKAKNARSQFNALFETVDDEVDDNVQSQQAIDDRIAIQEDLGL
jgi:hypothetical protein